MCCPVIRKIVMFLTLVVTCLKLWLISLIIFINLFRYSWFTNITLLYLTTFCFVDVRPVNDTNLSKKSNITQQKGALTKYFNCKWPYAKVKVFNPKQTVTQSTVAIKSDGSQSALSTLYYGEAILVFERYTTMLFPRQSIGFATLLRLMVRWQCEVP